jgi:hypothetical protein
VAPWVSQPAARRACGRWGRHRTAAHPELPALPGGRFRMGSEDDDVNPGCGEGLIVRGRGAGARAMREGSYLCPATQMLTLLLTGPAPG